VAVVVVSLLVRDGLDRGPYIYACFRRLSVGAVAGIDNPKPPPPHHNGTVLCYTNASGSCRVRPGDATRWHKTRAVARRNAARATRRAKRNHARTHTAELLLRAEQRRPAYRNERKGSLAGIDCGGPGGEILKAVSCRRRRSIVRAMLSWIGFVLVVVVISLLGSWARVAVVVVAGIYNITQLGATLRCYLFEDFWRRCIVP